MSDIEYLRSAKRLISKPENFCGLARARDINGADVPVMSKRAVSFCSKGALFRVIGGENRDISHLEEYLHAAMKSHGHYAGFSARKTHAEVMELWDKAIKIAEVGLPPRVGSKEHIEAFFKNVGKE